MGSLLQIFKIVGYLLSIGLFCFGVLQLYVSRKIAAIEANGVFLQIAGDPDSADPAIRWALTGLAPCRPLTRLKVAPEDQDALSQSFDGRWAACRERGRDLAEMKIGPFSVKDRLFCDDAKSTELIFGAIDAVLGDRSGGYPAGLTISSSDFSCATFDRGEIYKATVSGGHFVGASFVDVIMPDSEWLDVDLTFANFAGANLAGATFQGPELDLRGATFRGADLTGAIFGDGASLAGSDFQKANISDVDFSGSVGLSIEALRSACAAKDVPPTLPDDIGRGAFGVQECPASR